MSLKVAPQEKKQANVCTKKYCTQGVFQPRLSVQDILSAPIIATRLIVVGSNFSNHQISNRWTFENFKFFSYLWSVKLVKYFSKWLNICKELIIYLLSNSYLLLQYHNWIWLLWRWENVYSSQVWIRWNKNIVVKICKHPNILWHPPLFLFKGKYAMGQTIAAVGKMSLSRFFYLLFFIVLAKCD